MQAQVHSTKCMQITVMYVYVIDSSKFLAFLGLNYEMIQYCTEIVTFFQRFNQHFELLQKAGLPDQLAYFSFKDAADQARLSVSSISCH